MRKYKSSLPNLMIFISLLFFIAVYACKKDEESPNSVFTPTSTPNILLIIADDLGKDAASGFSEGSIKPSTPNIDALKTSGISFTNFWVYPTCSPTRASIITGKYGYRTGVKWASDEMNLSETILQKYINDNGSINYKTAIVGKWHLSGNNTSLNPESLGLDYYAGIFTGAVSSYYNWPLTEDGISSNENQYCTKKLTDLAKDWLSQQNDPWFLWLAYNAPHTPFHVPPNAMHNQGNLPAYVDGVSPMPYYMAAIEALDFQIGKLLESLSEVERENTLIIFIGDNGTPGQVAQSPYSSVTVKGSLYQGGINTPMYISGKGVSRTGIDQNLINSTDLFATIAAAAGVPVNEINDSKSFISLFSESSSLRDFQYSEMNNGTDDIWTISNGNFKLLENANNQKEFYDLTNDPYEQNNLLNGTLTSIQLSAKTELENELLVIRQ